MVISASIALRNSALKTVMKPDYVLMASVSVMPLILAILVQRSGVLKIVTTRDPAKMESVIATKDTRENFARTSNANKIA